MNSPNVKKINTKRNNFTPLSGFSSGILFIDAPAVPMSSRALKVLEDTLSEYFTEQILLYITELEVVFGEKSLYQIPMNRNFGFSGHGETFWIKDGEILFKIQTSDPPRYYLYQSKILQYTQKFLKISENL